jgi:hypothetical protein
VGSTRQGPSMNPDPGGRTLVVEIFKRDWQPKFVVTSIRNITRNVP